MQRKNRTKRAQFDVLEDRRVLDSTVVFNEVMYNPPAADESLEWIELHNQMAVDMDLSGWSIRGGIDFNFPEQSSNPADPRDTIIRGGDFLVIAKDPVAFTAATGVVGAGGPYTGQLANDGERVELVNNSDRVVDWVDYDDQDQWPIGPDGSGVSLAKIDRDMSSTRASNWKASQYVGGTPGTDNHPLEAGGLVMVIDPGTGFTSIHNVSGDPLLFDGYTIGSASNSLRPANGQWNSLQDQAVNFGNWFESNPSSANLSELNLQGSSALNPTESLSLGHPFNSFGTRDVTFEYLVVGGLSRQGEVFYGDLPTASPQSGILFNEIAAGVDPFFLELINTASSAITLDGAVLSSSAGNEYLLPPQTLPADGFFSLTTSQIGFTPSASEKLFLYARNRDVLLDAVIVDDVLRGRSEQHDDQWLYPSSPTPGATNSFSLYDEIVINEIMYHDRPNLSPFAESDEEWIELYNRGTTTVDLAGWQLEDAVNFRFPPGTTLAQGQYLVVARDAATLATLHPAATIIGDFSGNLSNRSARIRLLDANKNPTDEVQYFDGGRWAPAADGDGSSLELRDPDADNSRASAWAASRESDAAPWTTYSYTSVAKTFVPGSPTGRIELNVAMLRAGEILLDDMSVIDLTAGGGNLIQNSSFQSGLSRWTPLGNHRHSQTVVDPDDLSNTALHVIAVGAGEYQGNEIRTWLSGGSIINDHEYEISFRAKWLTGSNQLHTRFYFNKLPTITELIVPTSGGTPGETNSVLQANLGPTYSEFQHEPIVPDADQNVTVTVAATDLDGLDSMTLYWSADGGAWNNISMVNDTGDRFRADVPGFPAGTIVQFYVQGSDLMGASSTFPAAGADSRALYTVQDGRAPISPLHSFRIVMTTSDANFLHDGSNKLSNERLGATVVSDEQTVYYDVGVRLKGSAVGRDVPWTGFNLKFHPDQLFRDIHEIVAIDRSAHTTIGTSEILVKHVANHAGDIPSMFDDIAYIIAPRDEQTGEGLLQLARFEDGFLDSQFTNGSDGTQFELEGYRYGGYLDVAIRDYGDDPEAYRHHFLITNNRRHHDYSKIVELSKAMSLPGAARQTALSEVADLDQWLRVLALHSLTSIGDTYPSENHNIRFYVRPEDEKVLLFPWDWDDVFRGSGSGGLSAGSFSSVANLPVNRRLFEGHALDIINTTFNGAYMQYWLGHYGSLGGQDYSNFQGFVEQRASSVLSSLPAQTPFAISTNGGQNFSTQVKSKTLTGTGWIDVREIRLAGNSQPLSVLWLNHDSWRITVPLSFGANLIELEAYDHQGDLVGTDTITITSSMENPVVQSLRISELNYNPHDPTTAELAVDASLDNDDFEFVELHNTGSETIDLIGVQLADDDGLSFSFPAAQLAAGELAVVVRNQSAFEIRYGSEINVLGQYSGGGLGNAGDQLTLADGIGTTFLNFAYDDADPWPERADGAGATLTIVNSESTPVEQYGKYYHWRGSTPLGGSPGSVNLPPVGVTINEVLAHTDPPVAQLDTIELYNTTESPIDVGGWYLSDSSNNLLKFSIPFGTSLPAGGYLTFNEADFNPNPGVAPSFALSGTHGDDVWLVDPQGGGPGTLWFIDDIHFGASPNSESFGRLPDGSGRLTPMRSLTLGSANVQARVGPVVISELNYNPGPPSSEALLVDPNLTANDLEFLEISNPVNAAVDLTNWRIRGGVDFDFPVGTLLGTGKALAVLSFDPQNLANATRAAAFRTHHAIGSTVALLGGYQGQLSDSDELVRLERPDSPPPGEPTFIPRLQEDEVLYDDLSPWPAGAAGAGVSLHRTPPSGWGNDAQHWSPATPRPGQPVLLGDRDLDGDVDTLDITATIVNFTGAGGVGKTWLLGDTDGDGDVDTMDITNAIINFTGAKSSMIANLADDLNDMQYDETVRRAEAVDSSSNTQVRLPASPRRTEIFFAVSAHSQKVLSKGGRSPIGEQSVAVQVRDTLLETQADWLHSNF